MKNIFLTAGLMLLCILPTGCTKDTQEPATPGLQEIILSATDLSMTTGETCTLTFTTVPESIEGIVVTWTSSNEAIATVDNGTVTALAAGTASVTAACGDIQATCNVTVTDEAGVKTVTVSPEKATVTVGETVTLEATVEPADAEYELTWYSSNPDVASVDNNGTVTGLAEGDAVITAEAGGKTGSCNISVTGLPLESVELNETEISIKEGDTYTLKLTLNPENASYNTIAWSSSDDRIASVNQSGTVTGYREGSATITVDVDGMTAECIVNVSLLPISVGSIYYTDGTYSSTLDPEKEVLGIVFWLGDITAEDPALASEHPECTHGLVISANETEALYINSWQNNYAAYGKTVGEWVESNNIGYASPTVNTDGTEVNRAMGYNNTKAIEAFNAASENSEWTVNAVQAVVEFRNTYKVPANTSGWYLPSAKELALLACGDANVDVMSMESTENITAIDDKLGELGFPKIKHFHGMGGLPVELCSSTEPEDYTQALSLMAIFGNMALTVKDSGIYKVRPVLAF